MSDERLLWWVNAYPTMLGAGLMFCAASELLTTTRGVPFCCGIIGIAFGLWVHSRSNK